MWSYTPKMVDAYLFLGGRRARREKAEGLALAATAARGKPDAVKKKVKELAKD